MDIDGRDAPGGEFGGALKRGFPAATRWQAAGILALFVAADAGVAAICPLYGGDCLYGLFSLVVAPVMASGLLGVLLPRAARAAGWSVAARLTVLAAGGAVALALVAAGHVVAVRYCNALDYGGVLYQPRLLAVTAGLAAVYYLALAVIGLTRRPG